MQREDLIGGVGAIGSALIVVLGYLWSLGLLQLLFSFLAGSFSTYFIQRRLQVESEKRRIDRENGILMRDKVYGPLFQAMNQDLELLKDVKRPDQGTYNKNPMKDMEDVIEHYLFRLSEEELSNKVSQIYYDLLKYREARSRAERAVRKLTISKFTETYGHKVSNINPTEIHFQLLDHGTQIKYSQPIEAILKRTRPLELFQEAMTGLENPTIEVSISNYIVEDLTKLGEVFAELEQVAWKENRLLEHEELRKKLIDDLKTIIPKLEKRIVS